MFLPPAVLGPFYGGTGPSGIGTGVLPGAKPLKAPGKIDVSKYLCCRLLREQ